MIASGKKVEARMSYEEYVALEARSSAKHEYLRGERVAMAGATPEHVRIATAVAVALSNALRGRPCAVYSSDLRVRVMETDLATYPDVAVVCGGIELAPDDRVAATNPIVIVEVLSASTEGYDRGAKFAHYRHLPSLREYVLFSQDAPRVEVYRRNERGRFELFEAGPGESAELESIGARISVDDVYADPFAR